MLVQNAKGELLIIEVQNTYMQDYLLRMLFGTAKLVVDNMDKGMDYERIKKIISVNIVYFDLGHGEDHIYHGTTNYVGINKKDILTLSKREESVYRTEEISKLYPEYYIIKVNQFDEVAKNTLDEWINFFKNQEVSDDTQAKGLKEAREKLDVLKLSEAERKEYEGFITDWRDNYGVVVGNYNKGAFDKAIEVAKALKISGIATAIICKSTGLSEEMVAGL